MIVLRITDILHDRILLTREAARLLRQPLISELAHAKSVGSNAAPGSVTVDFAGVEGLAPSFLDELLLVFEGVIGDDDDLERMLIVTNPPTRLSSKFEAVARGHGMSVTPRADASWQLKKGKIRPAN